MKKTILIGLTTATIFGGNILSSGVVKEVKHCKTSKDMSILNFSSADQITTSSIAMCKNKDGSIKVIQTVSVTASPKNIDCTLSFSNDFSEVTEKCGDKINVWVDGVKK